MSKKKKERLKFKQFPKELSVYFIKRLIFCAVLLIGLIAFIIIAPKLWKAFLILLLAYLVFLGYNIYNYIQVITYKIKVYHGTIEKKEEDNLIGNGKSKLSVKGPCSLIVVPNSAQDPNMKFIVPVGSGFNCDPGNQVAIYSNPNEIYQKNDNAYYFNNPLLIYVTKI